MSNRKIIKNYKKNNGFASVKENCFFSTYKTNVAIRD